MHLGGEGLAASSFSPSGIGKGVDAQFANVILDRLHARFVGEGRIGVFTGMKGFGGIEGGAISAGDRGCGAQVAVDVEEFFGAGVVRFHIGVGDGPSRRDAAFMMDDAEIFGAHAKQGGAVNLGLSADEVGLLRVQRVAFLVLPRLFGVVAVVKENCVRCPS